MLPKPIFEVPKPFFNPKTGPTLVAQASRLCGATARSFKQSPVQCLLQIAA